MQMQRYNVVAQSPVRTFWTSLQKVNYLVPIFIADVIKSEFPHIFISPLRILYHEQTYFLLY